MLMTLVWLGRGERTNVPRARPMLDRCNHSDSHHNIISCLKYPSMKQQLTTITDLISLPEENFLLNEGNLHFWSNNVIRKHVFTKITGE